MSLTFFELKIFIVNKGKEKNFFSLFTLKNLVEISEK